MTANDLLAISASCELSSTHPIGNSIVTAAKNKGTFYRKTKSKVEEIAGKGIRAIQNGRQLLCGNVKLMQAFDVDLSSYQKEGSGSEVLFSLRWQIRWKCIVISDTLKDDAPKAIAAVSRDRI